ncbi:hypothetical protein GCM10007159_39950 [Modicisalibacter luteus]|nr:hypothetical protein GCM10007159_39950 [Halomonas lutea]
MLATSFASLPQVLMDFTIAIHAATLEPGVLDQSQQALVIPGPLRQAVTAPGIVAAGMHRHHAAQVPHRVLVRMVVDKRAP